MTEKSLSLSEIEKYFGLKQRADRHGGFFKCSEVQSVFFNVKEKLVEAEAGMRFLERAQRLQEEARTLLQTVLFEMNYKKGLEKGTEEKIEKFLRSLQSRGRYEQ